MRTIYKYPLELGLQTIKLPENSHILDNVIVQGNELMMYVELDTDPDIDMVDITVIVVGTGHPLPQNIEQWDYIDTVQQGPFVWHVYFYSN